MDLKMSSVKSLAFRLGLNVSTEFRGAADKIILFTLTWCIVTMYVELVSTPIVELYALYKNTGRIISGIKFRIHSDPLFKELNLLRFQDINIYLVGKFMFMVCNDDLVKYQARF